jgi:hypothetical protein
MNFFFIVATRYSPLDWRVLDAARYPTNLNDGPAERHQLCCVNAKYDFLSPDLY